MANVIFHARIHITGINPYVHVSAARAADLRPGWRKPLPVLVRINRKPVTPWRINLMPVGDGSFYLYLHGDIRRASNTKVGERIIVQLTFDSSYRGGPMQRMPDWFRKPLSANTRAAAAWKELPPSRKKEIVRYLARLKSREARARNVARALEVLSGTPGRFMARTWGSTTE